MTSEQVFNNSHVICTQLFKDTLATDTYSASKRRRFIRKNGKRGKVVPDHLWSECSQHLPWSFWRGTKSEWCNFCHEQIWEDWVAETGHIIPSYLYLKGDVTNHSVCKNASVFLKSLQFIKLDDSDLQSWAFGEFMTEKLRLFEVYNLLSSECTQSFRNQLKGFENLLIEGWFITVRY